MIDVEVSDMITTVVEEAPQPRYELLVRIAQGLDGKVQAEEKESALTELISIFMPLINGVATRTFVQAKKYGLATCIEDWKCDTIAMFFEITVSHYKPKSEGGIARFANYQKISLFNRMRLIIDAEKPKFGHGVLAPSFSKLSTNNFTDVAFLADLHDVEEEALNNIKIEEIKKAVSLINKIVNELLTEEQIELWNSYYLVDGKDRVKTPTSRNESRRVANLKSKVLVEFAKRRAVESLLT